MPREMSLWDDEASPKLKEEVDVPYQRASLIQRHSRTKPPTSKIKGGMLIGVKSALKPKSNKSLNTTVNPA